MAYNFKRIEKKWAAKWLKSKIYEPNFGKAKKPIRQAHGKPFYNLMMFPYPSAEGLHVGNMYAFTGSDVYGRFQRMRGKDVFEPIGLDGFGIHSENYAIKIGAHPVTQAKRSEKNFYRQLQTIGDGFAWREKLETYDPKYYRWTQWFFVQLFNRGLAYRRKSDVNWCPSCKTVLADEQVVAGKCERCGLLVDKKELEQWFFKITEYAERLLKNLKTLDWPEKVKIAQENWIGKSEGAEVEFRIKNLECSVKVFTTRPDTLFGATYLVVAPESRLVNDLEPLIKNIDEVVQYVDATKKKAEIDRIAEGREKTGVELKGVRAVNPANGEEIPVYIADYVLSGYGTGAIMAVPAHDARDYEFATKFKLPVKSVVEPPARTAEEARLPYMDFGYLINSRQFNGMNSTEAAKSITDFVKGKMAVKYKLRDWLISRQRYWGPPIPLVFCENCKKNPPKKLSLGEKMNPGWISVPENDLPVKLPFVKDFRPKGMGESPLASVPEFYKVDCPRCNSPARRETDVSDTFLDSAWYFIAYLLASEKWKLKIGDSTFSRLAKKWLPVNMYIGGAEHSVLHLLYTRFLAMVFKDMGITDFDEPFPKFRAHGLLIKDGMKMSKSKGNVVNPDEYVKKFGADTLRAYLMFLGPFQQGGDWRDEGIMGVVRFLNRVWNLARMNIKRMSGRKPSAPGRAAKISPYLHKAIKKITADIEKLSYNTCVSELMITLNQMEGEEFNAADFSAFVKLLAPFSPFITEEIWEMLGNRGSIHAAEWPKFNEKLTVAEEIDLIIQVGGRFRAKVKAPASIAESAARDLAMKVSAVAQRLAGQEILRVIFVPGKLINFVVK